MDQADGFAASSWIVRQVARGDYLVDAIILMAHGLHLHPIAEGMDSEIQINHLLKTGCTEIQGHLFAAAQSASQALDLLRKKEIAKAASCVLAKSSFKHLN